MLRSALGVVPLVVALTATGCGEVGTGEDLVVGCKADVELSKTSEQLVRTTPGFKDGRVQTGAALERFQARYDATLGRPVTDLRESAPEEIADDVDTLVTAARALRASGDPKTFQGDALIKTTSRIGRYYFENCGGTKARIVAVDWRYRGVERTYPAGVIRIALENHGDEVHMISLFRGRRDLVISRRTEIGQVVATPGEEDFLTISLSPGRYVMLCMVPKGTTASRPGRFTTDQPAHVELGMYRLFSAR